MIEVCPKFGPIVVTAAAKLPRNLDSFSKEVAVLHKVHLMNSEKLKIVPIEKVRQLVLDAAKSLPALHHKKKVLIGIPAECLAQLEVVIGLTDQKQRDLMEDDLQSQADEDVRASQQQLARLRPLALKYLASKADAENVLRALREESDFSLAAQTFRKLVSCRNAISIGGAEEIDEAFSVKAVIDLPATKSYLVTLVAKEMKDDGDIVCQLKSGENLHPVFTLDDFSSRLVHFKEEGEARFLMGYCMILGLTFQARVSLRLGLSAAGLTYRGSIIQFTDQPKILDSIQNAMAALSTSLFDNC